MSIKKIAEMTGASVSTVGRVLSNPDHKCLSEEMRQRILQAAREIEYLPNEAARNLKSGNTSKKEIYYINILLTRVVSEENDPFFDEMLRLAEIEIRSNGCIISSVWHRTDFSNEKYCMSENMENVVNKMYENKEHKSDGLIIIGKCCAKALKALKQKEKNIVSINRNSTNYEVDEVLCDGRKIALTAIEYLVRCGHSKVGYVGDCHNDSRFDGYQAAQMRYHLASDIDYVFDTTPNEDCGYKAAEYFMRQEDPPTAVYCSNDILAIGMLKRLGKRRSRYYNPSIISSDDITEAQYTSPMLTTISLPKNEMARFALMLLLDRIQGRHKIISRLEVEGTLIVRDSVYPITESFEPEYYI
ncbi:MAG: LacI family DNA-binding transcriptional regulator [Oscillospiraceae bacterium]|nr:LacI family DNA-binding transcriptional regulator [Oscillospiraceae bacterium]MBQ8780705.1 LacI family DNA-binding transcriptional regulator [Oscillospiraceae bacterium]